MATDRQTASSQEDGNGSNQQLANEAYTVGWICAISTEYVAARVFLDGEHEGPAYIAQHDNNSYTLGRMGKHNVVIAVLPDSEYGTASAATVARDMLHSFPNVRIGLMVGIGGGAPSTKNDIRLGDIIVSTPRGGYGGVFQYDFGKTIQDQTFHETGFLAQPPTVLRTAISGIKAHYESDGHQIQEAINSTLQMKPRLQKKYRQPNVSTDRLYRTDITHPVNDDTSCTISCTADTSALVSRQARDEEDDNPAVHYGLIASANQLMKDAMLRDKLAREKDVLCFEMEAAGLMNHFPCLVIRGICDYSDTHKNKEWQGYAAMTASAYAKDLLKRIAPNKVEAERKISEVLADMNKNLQAVQISSGNTQRGVEELQMDSYLEKIRRWLSPPDPSTNLNKAREQHHEGTGQWFLDSDQYRKWKIDANSFLWLNGIPGCGKTILSSSVVADLEQSTAPESLIYFYFDFNDIEKRSLEKAVRSLVDQLYYKRKEVRIDVDALYRSCEEGRRQPDNSTLYKLFQGMLQKVSKVWLILDALDECHLRDDSFTNGLLPWIERNRGSGVNIHMLVTSRPEYDIKATIKGWACDNEIIPIQSSLVEADIEAYIKTRTKRMERWQKRPDIQKEIEDALIRKADGMFRWVSCQFDILKDCRDRPAVRRELDNLPRTLDETYARILSRVQPEHMRYTTRLLQFLAYSERPLRLEEAVDALAVDTSSRPRFDAANRTEIPEEVAAYCAGLVILVKTEAKDKETAVTEIQLAHFSVQEYLTSDRLEANIANDLQETVARLSIVTVCLSYLLDIEHSYTISEARKQYPMVQYCARYWAQHAAVIEGSDKQVPIVKEYFSHRTAFKFGYQLYSPNRPWQDEFNKVKKPVTCLYYASVCSLLHSTKELLLGKGEDVNAQGGPYGNALQAASEVGHTEIVQTLLEKGADVNAQGGEYGNALQAASKGGHKEIVQTLLEKGADVNAQGRPYGNALQTASLIGHKEIVQTLLEKGADVNAQGGPYGNALQAASLRRHKEIVQTLLDKGADVNAQGEPYGTVLQAASKGGHREIVQTLLEKGADINAQGGPYGNALQVALNEGHKDIAQLLRASAIVPDFAHGLKAEKRDADSDFDLPGRKRMKAIY